MSIVENTLRNLLKQRKVKVDELNEEIDRLKRDLENAKTRKDQVQAELTEIRECLNGRSA